MSFLILTDVNLAWHMYDSNTVLYLYIYPY